MPHYLQLIGLQNGPLYFQESVLGKVKGFTLCRRMFPALQLQISELEPQSVYCIFLEMVPAAKCRYKYTTASGWTPAGSEEVQSPHRLYMHPEGPAKGEYWMSQPVSFGRLKLTNTPAPPAGQVVLSSMHKYQPRIIVVKTADPSSLGWAPSTCIVFTETQFIAVTAYQNEKITQLKIDNNPFAKGFRHNGQAKCKRKLHQRTEEETSESDKEELINVVDDEPTQSTEEKYEKKKEELPSEPHSPPAKIAKTDCYACVDQTSCSNDKVLPHQYYNNYWPQLSPLYYSYYPYVFHHYSPVRDVSNFYRYPGYKQFNHHQVNHQQSQNIEPPRTLTNFSIDYILSL